jgi:hypothetical protein
VVPDLDLHIAVNLEHPYMYHSDMLSEKAKGKQRAIDPFLDVSATHSAAAAAAPAPEETSRELVVRFTEGAPDLTITVHKRDSVRDVKKHVRVLPLKLAPARSYNDGLVSRSAMHVQSCTIDGYG